MEIASRARFPLVTTILAGALLAAFTGAANHGAGPGNDAAQQLVVTPAAADQALATAVSRAQARSQAAVAGTTPTAPVPGAGTGVEPAIATGAIATAAIATAAAAADSGTVQVDPAPQAQSEPEPAVVSVPVRPRVTAPPTTGPPAAPTTSPPPAGLTRLPNVELEVLTRTNLDRGNNGLSPVARDACMDAEASVWAHSMAESTTMTHSAGAGDSVQGCRGASAYWGDNIGYWQPCYASEMQAWWMASPSHRPHIIDANFTAVGIGVWSEPSGRCWFQVYFGS